MIQLYIYVFLIFFSIMVYQQNCFHDSFAEGFEASCLSPAGAQFSSFNSPPEQMCDGKCHDWPRGLLREGSGRKET